MQVVDLAREKVMAAVVKLAEKPTSKTKQCKIVMVCAPKGGVGKTTMARSLLVNAVINDKRAIGIDFDEQQSLITWAMDRERTRAQIPGLGEVIVRPQKLSEWRLVPQWTNSYDLAVIDTPPGVGGAVVAIMGLCEKAAFTLVPTGTSSDDLRKVIPWGETLAEMGVRFGFVLSRVNDRTVAYKAAVRDLNRIGMVLPVPIPALESIPVNAEQGMTVLDVEAKGSEAKGSEAFEATWNSIRRECVL
jgi:chromosome partitioning protein